MNLRFLLVAVIAGVNSYSAADFRATAEMINDTIRANHYRAAELDSETYRQIERGVIALGENARSAEEFIDGFNAIWRKGPFSHVRLRKAQESAAERIAKLDTLVVGPDAVALTWQGSTAVLTVNTMNGADTIEAINNAYGEIVGRKAEKLIIDLRRNDGGAFAVVPLVGHLLEHPIDAGVFVVGSWYADHREATRPCRFSSAEPWRGYSVGKFQRDVMTRPLTSYRIEPMQPVFRVRSSSSPAPARSAPRRLRPTPCKRSAVPRSSVKRHLACAYPRNCSTSLATSICRCPSRTTTRSGACGWKAWA